MAAAAWTCSACTWVNENANHLSCEMCQSERRTTPPTLTTTLLASNQNNNDNDDDGVVVGNKNKKWDAFASMQFADSSSDDDGDEDDDDIKLPAAKIRRTEKSLIVYYDLEAIGPDPDQAKIFQIAAYSSRPESTSFKGV